MVNYQKPGFQQTSLGYLSICWSENIMLTRYHLHFPPYPYPYHRGSDASTPLQPWRSSQYTDETHARNKLYFH
jgi:hypothetical protein